MLNLNRRHRIHVSIALAGAIAIGLLVWLWMRGHEQKRAIAALGPFHAAIEVQYGKYDYSPPSHADVDILLDVIPLDEEWNQMLILLDQRPWWLAWIDRFLGPEFGARVTKITIHDAQFTDADVDLLLGFPNLREIDLSRTSVTDAGIANLITHDGLTMLSVSYTRVTGQSLRLLVDCRELRELRAFDAGVDEETVRFLKQRLPDCEIYR